MSFRFIHTADLHLDSPLKSLALKNPDLSELVRGATRQALVRIVDLCIEEAVDALLIAGDLYDGAQTSMSTALFLVAQLRRLEDAGIQVFIVRGNHDAQSRITRELTLPPNTYVFTGKAKPFLAKITPSGREVYVHGLSFNEPHAPQSLLPGYAQPVPGAVNLGIMHTSVAGGAGHDLYAPVSVANLTSHGFDYWALGHIHHRQIHSDVPLVVMPGMPQGRDINEAGPKSVTLVTVHSDGTWTHEERVISVAVFERCTVDCSGLDTWSDLVTLLQKHIQSARAECVCDHLILRLILVGRTSLSWRLRRDHALLMGEVSAIAQALGHCWIEAVQVACETEALTEGRVNNGPDPIEELAGLIDRDVTEAAGYRREVETLLQDVLRHLPPEARDGLAANEEEEAQLIAMLIEMGGKQVLSRLNPVLPEAHD
ncbi:DNA repair exonuclease [Rhizobium sp. CFBP 8762]|uniref:metallophosphoesterase family protein n=1 Tax=Rhizobium sp. CFBP 8762 TaxID=2775279 RepID=UPI0017859F72|nr:DNA repair exonuclease [Rhizobium sp. CFBP 8762]MBD8552969.1 DNA repair exonuclease [Rhizobium sp. CFBP 8762]